MQGVSPSRPPSAPIAAEGWEELTAADHAPGDAGGLGAGAGSRQAGPNVAQVRRRWRAAQVRVNAMTELTRQRSAGSCQDAEAADVNRVASQRWKVACGRWREVAPERNPESAKQRWDAALAGIRALQLEGAEGQDVNPSRLPDKRPVVSGRWKAALSRISALTALERRRANGVHAGGDFDDSPLDEVSVESSRPTPRTGAGSSSCGGARSCRGGRAACARALVSTLRALAVLLPLATLALLILQDRCDESDEWCGAQAFLGYGLLAKCTSGLSAIAMVLLEILFRLPSCCPRQIPAVVAGRGSEAHLCDLDIWSGAEIARIFLPAGAGPPWETRAQVPPSLRGSPGRGVVLNKPPCKAPPPSFGQPRAGQTSAEAWGIGENSGTGGPAVRRPTEAFRMPRAFSPVAGRGASACLMNERARPRVEAITAPEDSVRVAEDFGPNEEVLPERPREYAERDIRECR
ncbi:unnamed protein product [Prorocentrum cordatum]|uniref:Uncharacterized protein n=1 Tax=Prorocentrum cordatum TaxID=2364126 RepID=A0ABN9UWC8_9DINO|nr:unnamed protein product [Polarella glacialis]